VADIVSDLGRQAPEGFGDAAKMRSRLIRFIIHCATTFRSPRIPQMVMEVLPFDKWQNRVNAPGLTAR
jgi:hypothetical protein